jgi:hypothetical protein
MSFLPRYFFAVRAGGRESLERVAELSDDAAALAFGCDIVRELTKKDTVVGDPALVLRVRDETRPMVFSVPFLAAYA